MCMYANIRICNASEMNSSNGSGGSSNSNSRKKCNLIYSQVNHNNIYMMYVYVYEINMYIDLYI